MKITDIVDNQMPSITEWMEKINLKNLEEFRQEDNNKRDRLEVLYEIIGLQYDRPEKMMATDIINQTDKFKEVFTRYAHEKCALRLVPIRPSLPKLRVRGKTLEENLVWFNQQNINHGDYKVEVIPHNDNTLFSAILLIDDEGIWGEIIPGPHWQITQGILEHQQTNFWCDHQEWHFKNSNSEIENLVKEATKKLQIPFDKQNILREKLEAQFNKSNFLKGYFEFVVWPNTGISFIDYNRIIYNNLKKFSPKLAINSINGTCASPGTATGQAHLVIDPKNCDFKDGEILICHMTTIDYVPLMKKAGGIITEQGNILSHAAIVARELNKPCLVGVKGIFDQIKDGDKIILDATNGQIIS